MKLGKANIVELKNEPICFSRKVGTECCEDQIFEVDAGSFTVGDPL